MAPELHVMIWGFSLVMFILLRHVILEHRQREKDMREFERLYHERQRLIHEWILQNEINKFVKTKKASKWSVVDENSKSKILKIRELAIRGEAGEKTAAQNRLNLFLEKLGLELSDLPSMN